MKIYFLWKSCTHVANPNELTSRRNNHFSTESLPEFLMYLLAHTLTSPVSTCCFSLPQTGSAVSYFLPYPKDTRTRSVLTQWMLLEKVDWYKHYSVRSSAHKHTGKHLAAAGITADSHRQCNVPLKGVTDVHLWTVAQMWSLALGHSGGNFWSETTAHSEPQGAGSWCRPGAQHKECSESEERSWVSLPWDPVINPKAETLRGQIRTMTGNTQAELWCFTSWLLLYCTWATFGDNTSN